MTINSAGLLLIGAYAIFLLAAAGTVRDKNTAASFFVNKRGGSAWSVALSIIVSCVGASATLGVIGKAFAVGTPAFWWLGAGAAGLGVLALFLAQKVRDSGAYTLPQMVEAFLGKATRPLISLVIVVAWMAILAAQFSALERILESMTGLRPGLCLALAFALIVVHSSGGQAVIMRLDRLQSFLLAGGLVMVMAWLWARNPAWHQSVRLEVVNEAFRPPDLFYYLFVVGGNYLVCPMLFGRLFSARDSAAARRGGIYATAGLAACSALIVCIGLACVGLIPAETPQDAVLAKALVTLLPDWLRLLVFLALVSAVVSSADTCLVTAATVLSFDLLRRDSTLACRSCVAGLGLAGLALSLMDKSILGFLLMAYDVYVCGVVVPVFIGLVCAKRRVVRQSFA